MDGTLRDESLKLEKIDEDYIAQLVDESWRRADTQRETSIENDRLFEDNWRQLTRPDATGPWDNSANFHVPLSLTYGKATFARLWQLFSNPAGFFEVQSRQEAFRDKEPQIKNFMNWVLNHYANSKLGVKGELKRWLWDVVLRGDGYFKVYWKKEEFTYKDVEQVLETEEETIFSPESPTGRVNIRTKVIEREVEKTDVCETPQLRRVLREDVVMPAGYSDPQEAPFVVNRVFMTDEQMKAKVEAKTFNREAVEASITAKQDIYNVGDTSSAIKGDRLVIDGFNQRSELDYEHVILEYYGPAFISKDVDPTEDQQDLDKRQAQIVAWVHHGTRRVLGWTYLHRVSPGGLRPLFKADFMTFPDRQTGVGIAELTFDANRHVDALFNLRFDNGTLASIPMFAYRHSSNSLKPTVMRMRPGAGIPVDDINDIKQFQFPFLANFGLQEEQNITNYAERLLSISDIQLGRAPAKVGALRNATGSSLLENQAGIQLEIHFDNIASCISKALQFLFRLCRERMPESLFFRVTGELGQPIFGKVSREDLKGEYDFDIQVDILSQSEIQKQQQATLMLQTLLNPAGTQTGIVTPDNIYNLYKNFLRAYKVPRVTDFISTPPNYQGPAITTLERIARIMLGVLNGLEETVRFDENHEEALRELQSFEDSDNFALLTQPVQVAAYAALKAQHEKLLQAQQAGLPPNVSGMQVPRDGLAALSGSVQPDQGTLGAPMGEVNGPVY